MADDDDPLAQQLEVLAALTRLAVSLKEYNDKESAPKLSHYRHMPEAVTQSYDLLYQGAQLIHATSTKYTLLGKIDAKEQTKMTQDLLQGCQLLATGCLVLHDDQSGCVRSTRQHCKQACRAIVHTVIQLVEVWVQEAALGEGNNLGAQKTGAVWEMCDTILQRRLPKGNRNSMRRDLLTFMKECVETANEFQEIIDAGPSLREEDGNQTSSDDGWENFMGGGESQYTMSEIPVATACLYVIKCSRGSINAAFQVIEAIGEQVEQDTAGEKDLDAERARLAVIARAHDLARDVGNGMTDLGATMYPPLQLDALKAEVEKQTDSVAALLDQLADTTCGSAGAAETLDLPEEVNELLSKIRDHLPSRRENALKAINVCYEERNQDKE